MRLTPGTASHYEWYYLVIDSLFVFKWAGNNFALQAKQCLNNVDRSHVSIKRAHRKCLVIARKDEEGDQSHFCDCATLAGWDRPLALHYLLRCLANSRRSRSGVKQKQPCPLRKILQFCCCSSLWKSSPVLKNNYLSCSSSSNCLQPLVASFPGLSYMQQLPLTLSTSCLYVPEGSWLKVVDFMEH